MQLVPLACPCFFFNDTATTEIYTLSLHDALPICASSKCRKASPRSKTESIRCWAFHRPDLPIRWTARNCKSGRWNAQHRDRKSTRLNSSHDQISYAVFCLKKKKNNTEISSTHTET